MPSRHTGFTLIELMISLIVLGVVVTVAIPNLQGYMLQNRVKTAAQDMFTSLLYARSEAVKRDARVYMIPADADDWSEGWIVTQEEDRTFDECQDGESGCLRIQQSLDGLSVASDHAQVIYRGNGRVAESTEFGFCVSGNPSIQQRVVSTDLSGRPSIVYEGDCS
ncbi:MAG: GspH/FimT family pseudopilin [Halofilum sp. (in: g-proteobacteria)]